MLLIILCVYLFGATFIGIPILGFCNDEAKLSLTNGMAFAIIVFHPIILVTLLIYGAIIAIKGLLSFIILLFKGELF